MTLAVCSQCCDAPLGMLDLGPERLTVVHSASTDQCGAVAPAPVAEFSSGSLGWNRAGSSKCGECSFSQLCSSHFRLAAGRLAAGTIAVNMSHVPCHRSCVRA